MLIDMADPFYEEILEALAKPLDKDRFELCAASLLTKEFPTLVPIRGGTDDGMDGATGRRAVAQRFQQALVCSGALQSPWQRLHRGPCRQ